MQLTLFARKRLAQSQTMMAYKSAFGTPERIVQVIMSNKIMPKFYDLFLNSDFAPKTITYKKVIKWLYAHL